MWRLCGFVCALQVQAYKLAIEQHRNFELRVPANVNMRNSFYKDVNEAMLHSSSGSLGPPGSTDGMMTLQGTGGPPPQQQQQGPMHGVRGWGSNAADNSQQSQGAVAAGGENAKQQAPDACKCSPAVVAAMAAAAERCGSHVGDVQPRRRSIGGGMRYIRFQFRSVASVGSHMAPAVSVPPALVSVDRTNYYWATVDVPVSSVHGENLNDMTGGYSFGISQQHEVRWGCHSSGCRATA